MGQIAPRRRRTRAPRTFTLPRLQRWLPQMKRKAASEEDSRMASDTPSRVPAVLLRVWHLLDNVRWMDPLPAFHRRGIVIALLVLLLAFLWPSSTPQYPIERQAENSSKEVPLQAEIYDNKQPPKADSQGEWHSYTVASGQTLAQLFRDNNLPVNDVFAMARVEGSDQPLSALKNGQQVKVRQNAQGVVTGLTVDGSDGPVLFTRQPDGSFIRAQ
ncbi:Opacity-associated protein A [Pantoea sp. Acro-805]|uniref:Opacity-associated protein A n=1 Tax=Candidatus Pantoea formicae TaxID=2608355 RepID=A0ABX0R416_9GAMM|nr:LysM-like peptidoglycan-binding domain-containing protein [Pantoea formicae]MDF7648149.1 LysM-like peptidoglycan-binding domain-containing protein [Erwiniaceae bacterium L1_54_3]NIF02036.1 Opacity-associated protein A [Pantoea formicae]